MVLKEGRYRVKSADGGFHPPEEPQLEHLMRDIEHAIEEECFEVETPRVHATQDHFDWLRVFEERGPPQLGQLAHQPGPPMAVVEAEWHGDDMQLFSDLKLHAETMTEPIVLYGLQHLWSMKAPLDFNVKRTRTEEGVDYFVRFGWREFDHAGWR